MPRARKPKTILLLELGGKPVHMYVTSFDPDGAGGRGHVGMTPNRDEALEFPDAEAALRFWRQQSTVHPFRESDGKPNRPLTAYTVEIA